MTQKFSIGEALSFGWDVAKKNLGFFIIIFLLTAAINVFLIFIEILIILREGSPFFLLILRLIHWVVNTIINMGFVKISLKLYDNEETKVSDLFSAYPLFLNYAIGSILYVLIVFGGSILLIVPGIIFFTQFFFLSYFIVDKGLGPIEALKRSSEITKGVKLKLLLFFLVSVLVGVSGALAFLVGLIITVPTVLIANAFIYRKLLSQTKTLQEAVVPPAPSSQ